jgi:hypothetical protein|tara:strand:- start:42 stop:425 length:384 start_codon:yes stop_codon:yes gene_type:complete
MKISKERLKEIIREEFDKVNEESSVQVGKNTEFYQGFSSKEAKSAIDKGVKDYSALLRKAQYKIIKDWMSKAKSGVVDYFDLVRGLQTGDAKRAHPYETDFLMKMLQKDKIMDRFRKYFGGKKGKKR